MNFGSIWSKAATTSSDVVIGIDFGTSNSCVSVWRPDKKRIKIIRNKVKPIGNKTTPSTILFEDGFDEWTIGSTNFFDDDNSILSNIKPCLGADGAVTSNEIIGLKSQFDAAGDKLMIECMDQNQNTRLFSAEDLASKILKYLKECAEEYLTRKPFKIVGEDGRLISPPAAKKDSTVRVTKVVIGIPVNYTERKKDAIRSAAFSAGFEEVHLMIESTAAAMSYGLLVAGTKHVLVVDIGGGTTDLTVMHISDGTYSIEATGGHVTLGGCNMDLRMYELVVRKIMKELSTAVSAGVSSLVTSVEVAFENLSRRGAKSQLLQLCKACKEELSGVDEARIAVPSVVSDCFYVSEQQQTANKASKSHPVLEITVSRAEFSAAIKDITDLITGTIVHTVQQWIDKKATASGTAGGISFDVKSCIDEIVLVGGASRVPAVHSAIRAACETLGIAKYAEHTSAAATSDESGGENTATASGKKNKKKTGKSASAEKSAALTPTASAAIAPYEFCTSVDPDQVVAEGLAIRGAILSGATDCSTLKDILMMDCLAMSVGLMSWSSSSGSNSSGGDNSEKNRKFDAILHKGDKLPAKASKVFQLGDSNQRFVSLDMYEQIDQQRLVPGAGGAPNTVETEFIFNVIGTADVPIPPRPASSGRSSAGTKGGSGSSSSETRRSIEVVFRMDDQGTLSYEVLHCEEGDNGGSDNAGSSDEKQEEDVDPQSSRASLYLLLYIGLMVALYIAVKVLLVEAQIKEGGTSDIGNIDNGDSGDNTLSDVVSGIVERVSAYSDSDADIVITEL